MNSPNMVSFALEGARMNAALIAVLELKLCEHLTGRPCRIDELADRAAVSVRGAQALADAMVALKLWSVESGTYRNTSAAEEYLVPSGAKYVGDEQPGLFRAWITAFVGLPQSVRTGKPAFTEGHELVDFWSLLTPVIARSGQAVASQALDALGAKDANNLELLDVGGGARALYSLAALNANPRARASQVDWPEMNAQARATVSAAGHDSRFSTSDGDFREVALGVARFDVVVLSHVLHQESFESAQKLVARAASALRAGGRLVICEWVVDDGRAGPPPALLFNTAMLLLSSQGKSYERSELTRMVEGAKLLEPRFERAGPTATLLFARKP